MLYIIKKVCYNCRKMFLIRGKSMKMNRIKAIIVAITLLTGTLGLAVTSAHSGSAGEEQSRPEPTLVAEETLDSGTTPEITVTETPTPTEAGVPDDVVLARPVEAAFTAHEYGFEDPELLEVDLGEIEIPEIVLGAYNDKENVSAIADGQEVTISEMLQKTPLPTATPTPTPKPVEDNAGDGETQEDDDQPIIRNYIRQGIDVSAANGDIDWEAVAASGIEFAIVRVGYRGYETGKLVADPNCYKNLEGATAAGIKVGAYFFSQALTEKEAAEEAALACEIVKNYNITYPIAFDFEEWHYRTYYRIYHINQAQANRNARAFMDYVKSMGYTPALYGGKWDFRGFWDMDLFSDCVIWLAYYAADLEDDYEGRHTLWQYTGKGHVPGISTYVDLDMEYVTEIIYPEKENEEPEEVEIELPEGFTAVNEKLTTNSPDALIPAYSLPDDSEGNEAVLMLDDGMEVIRRGISDEWSLILNGTEIVYIRNEYLDGITIEDNPTPSVTPETGEEDKPTESAEPTVTVEPGDTEEPTVTVEPGDTEEPTVTAGPSDSTTPTEGGEPTPEATPTVSNEPGGDDSGETTPAVTEEPGDNTGNEPGDDTVTPAEETTPTTEATPDADVSPTVEVTPTEEGTQNEEESTSTEKASEP